MRTLLLPALLLFACRQEPIREPVYTGRVAPPTTVDAGTSTLSVDAGVITERFTRAALLADVEACGRTKLDAFVEAARALSSATAAHAMAPSLERKEAARLAWGAAMSIWQELEVFRFGPAAAPPAVGGLNLRDEIYAWPLVGPCQIDERIVSRAYAEPTFSRALINVRGLGAVEYLLFYEGASNACAAQSAINANGTWAELDAEALAARRAEYAARAAELVVPQAEMLRSAWSAHFAEMRFPTDQAALNAVSDGLFYLEIDVKDRKLARPIGLMDCGAPPCVDAVESRWARASKAHLEANLRGFGALFAGCGPGGVGFDDWLVEAGANDLATRMLSAHASALLGVSSLPGALDELLARDPRALDGIHALVKSVTDPLKTEMTSVLDLELPMVVEGDND